MKDQKQQLLLETAEQNNEIIYKDNKVWAKLDWIIPWNKNPKFIEDIDLEKLKNQIKELDVYKPLVVAFNDTNAIILGGNQRFKALKELAKENPEKYKYVWVSLVECINDEERLKYALSDNLSLGKYKKEELYEIIKPLANQGTLFNDYGIEISNTQSLMDFCEDFIMGEEEVKKRSMKNTMKELKINDETIHIIEEMVDYSKTKNKIEDVEIKGITEKNEKYPIIFWFENKDEWQKAYDTFSINGTRQMNKDLLLEKI